MIDPLAEVVTMLQPNVRISNLVRASSPWHVRGSDAGRPFYCVILQGECRLSIDGHESIELISGDFVLVPATHAVTMSSLRPLVAGAKALAPVKLGNGECRVGSADDPVDLQMVAGHCSFGSPDATLLVSLLPPVVHVRGEARLATLVELVRDETREQRPARDRVLSRLLEVLLIEALRSAEGTSASPGLVRGLADARLAAAICTMHERPTYAWTVAKLAKAASLSRSTFFERFGRAVGVAPMSYLRGWRMALAKDLLRRNGSRVAEIAERVGYGSASTFSVAFTRHVGQPPMTYAREQAAVGLAKTISS